MITSQLKGLIYMSGQGVSTSELHSKVTAQEDGHNYICALQNRMFTMATWHQSYPQITYTQDITVCNVLIRVL